MNRNTVLITDTACDLPKPLLSELGVTALPLSVITGEESLDIPQFYRDLRTGMIAFTSAVRESCFYDSIRLLLEDGRDVVYIGFSSALSASYDNAEKAAARLRPEYPERRVICIDSKCASMGQGLLVYLAARYLDGGKTAVQLAAYVLELAPHLCHWFTVDDLNFLKRGGRISATVGTGGQGLHMKPVLHVDDEGHLVSVRKVRGRDAAIQALYGRLRSTAENIADQTVMISHGDCLADANVLARLINDECHPKDIIIGEVNPVIGAHAGPGTLALFFLGSVR